MVGEAERWILVNTKVDPLTVAQVFGCTENECWDYIQDHARALRREEEAYNASAVQAEVRAWVNEMPDRKNLRIEALKGQLMDAKTHPERHNIEKILTEIKILKGMETITDQDIERAKAYPIQNLLSEPLIRGMAKCPLHNEKTPSFSVKNNKWKCFGTCGIGGDSIDLYMKLNNTDFISAVKALQC